MSTMRPTNQIISDIVSSRLDKDSLIVQFDYDSGDSAYRSAIFAFLLNKLNHPQAKEYYNIMIKKLTVEPGEFHRTSNILHWGYDSDNFSRDQAAAVKLAATVNEDYDVIETFNKKSYDRKELKQVPKWGWLLSILNTFIPFHQNIHPGTDAPLEYKQVPDMFGWQEVSNDMRRKGGWWRWALLVVRDVAFIYGLYERKGQPWDYDSLYAKDLIYANSVLPTPFSMLAKKLYAKTDYIERIRTNYADKFNGIEPLGELYEVVCRKYINEEG